MEMMAQVGEIVGRQEAKGHWLSSPNAAWRVQLGRRYVGNKMSEVTVVGCP